MRISEEVKEGLYQGNPVVALESTIIAQGLPYPENIRVAIELEQLIRDNGGIPATIGIIKGEIIIGMNKNEIEYIATAPSVMKLSTREIPLCVASGLDGATTVSATSYIAEKAHINVFATGGIGGVHRDVISTFDISRDLEELSERDIIIVSSGAKSILDIPKTVEFLETKGVLVVGFQCNEFPSFYSRKSGVRIPSVNSYEEVSRIFKAKKELSIKGAILVANPVPEEEEIPYETMEKWINEALELAKENGVSGKNVTPFLLSKIFELSEGKALSTNIALVKNNARIATLIAKEILS